MRIDADRLRQLREQRAWSQEQLAEIAGLSTRTVQRVERGERASHETRMALAAALGLSVEDILHSPASDVSARPEVREGEAIAADSREVQTSVPDNDPRDQADRLFRSLLLGLLAALVLVLVIGLGYQFGRDLANKHNRKECVASGRIDC